MCSNDPSHSKEGKSCLKSESAFEREGLTEVQTPYQKASFQKVEVDSRNV